VIYIPLVILFGVFAVLTVRGRRVSTWDVLVLVGFGLFLGATLVGGVLSTEIYGFFNHTTGGGK
jgi:hypothetical protein